MAESSNTKATEIPPLSSSIPTQSFTSMSSLMDSIHLPLQKDGEDARYMLEKDLALRLSRDFEFGSHADSELYADLARAFLRCRMRSQARETISSAVTTVSDYSKGVQVESQQGNGNLPTQPQVEIQQGKVQPNKQQPERRQSDQMQSEEPQNEGPPLEVQPQKECQEVRSGPSTTFSEEWEFSEDENEDGSIRKVDKHARPVNTPGLESIRSKSPVSVPEEETNSVEISTSSSMSEDDEEHQEVVEELRNMKLDRETYISSTSTEGEVDSQVPHNLLRDFESMGTNDHSSTKENFQSTTINSENISDPSPIPKQVATPLSSRSPNRSDNEMDSVHRGIEEMMSNSSSYSPTIYKEPLLSDQSTVNKSSPIIMPKIQRKCSTDTKSDGKSISSKTDDSRDTYSPVTLSMDEPKSVTYRKSSSKTGESRDTCSPVTLCMDEAKSVNSTCDSKENSATSCSDTKASNCNNGIKNHSMERDRVLENNLASESSKSPSAYISCPPEEDFDDTDLSPTQPLNSEESTSFPDADDSKPSSSFEFPEFTFPSSVPQFEIGSVTDSSTNASSKRSKGRKKMFSSNVAKHTVSQTSPSSLGRHAREEASNSTMFNSGDMPDFKFCVDLTSEKHKGNTTAEGNKFGRRVDDGKSKTTFTTGNTTAASISFGMSDVESDAMDVDVDSMDVDTPTPKSFNKPAEGLTGRERENVKVSNRTAEGAVNIATNVNTKSFSMGLGDTASTSSNKMHSGRKYAKTRRARMFQKPPAIVKTPSTESADQRLPQKPSSIELTDQGIPKKSSILPRTASTESIDTRQIRNSWSDNNSNNSTASQSQKNTELDEAEKSRRLQVAQIREEGRVLYLSKNYKESVLKYTAAIGVSTDDFNNFPDPLKNLKNCELLASLYGNRAAALMMINAYEAAASDCQKALGFLKKHDPLSYPMGSSGNHVSHLNGDAGIMLMAKLLTRRGRAYVKLGQTNDAQKTFETSIKVAQAALLFNEKLHEAIENGHDLPVEIAGNKDNILNQCKLLNQTISDARLNLIEITRMKDLVEAINSCGGVRADIDAPMSKIKNRQMFERINSVLSSAPAYDQMIAGKIFCLGSMRKWRELASFCEQLACKHCKFDGVFTKDLEEFNPFPSVPDAQHLHPKIFPNEDKDFGTVLNHKQVVEAVLRLPYGIVPIYARALRLEERYIEAGKAITALSTHAEKARPVWSPIKQRQKARYYWLASERDKLRRTISSKNKGDDAYKNADYQRAAEGYTAALKIDGEGSHLNFSCDPWDFETAGGRLHAVLHCNRAACLMALTEYQSAAKECTAALRIENQYMKATLRRARCYMRLQRYAECIAEYKCWIGLVEQARKYPGRSNTDECSFDRASEVSDRDFKKAKSELEEVLNLQQKKDRRARDIEREAEHKVRARAQATKSASARRQQWYDQKGEAAARRWDSFAGSSPKKDTKSSSFQRPASTRRYANVTSQQKIISPSSSSVTCHYDILQVPKMASQGDIKKAYRKMALKYHPDKNPGESSADVFRKIKLAYETLSDASQRKRYDLKNLRQFYS